MPKEKRKKDVVCDGPLATQAIALTTRPRLRGATCFLVKVREKTQQLGSQQQQKNLKFEVS